MLIVPGINLKSLRPRFWDPDSEYYLPEVKSIMVSYADFDALPNQRKRAMDNGIHQFFRIKRHRVQVYLDNGAFHFLSGKRRFPEKDYTEFIEKAKPDWYPVPRDYIPTPSMSTDKQRYYFQRTMEINRAYQHDGYVPIIHVGRYLQAYLESIEKDRVFSRKPEFGLGGLVPNLLRTPNAPSHTDILASIHNVRNSLREKKIHVFGIGGVSTIHLAALLELDSIDSSGWRNRAVRGIIQLPGTGDRMVKKLGSWNVRQLSKQDREKIDACQCPACSRYGIEGLRRSKTEGFDCRAIHNLYVLFDEKRLIELHLKQGTYPEWYNQHLANSIYKPLIDEIIHSRKK